MARFGSKAWPEIGKSGLPRKIYCTTLSTHNNQIMSVSNESEVIGLLNDKNVNGHLLTFGLQSTLIMTGNSNAGKT